MKRYGREGSAIHYKLGSYVLDDQQGMDTQSSTGRAPEAPLRALWEDTANRAASQGQESDEQLIRQLADAMPSLPYQRALAHGENALAEASSFLHRLRQACQASGIVRDPSESIATAWIAASGEEKNWIYMATCRGQWVAEWPDTPRVAHGVPKRVDRLKGLGNAVVPQIVEWIGQRILEDVRAGA